MSKKPDRRYILAVIPAQSGTRAPPPPKEYFTPAGLGDPPELIALAGKYDGAYTPGPKTCAVLVRLNDLPRSKPGGSWHGYHLAILGLGPGAPTIESLDGSSEPLFNYVLREFTDITPAIRAEFEALPPRRSS